MKTILKWLEKMGQLKLSRWVKLSKQGMMNLSQLQKKEMTIINSMGLRGAKMSRKLSLYGKQSKRLSLLNSVTSFLSGWFNEPNYVTLRKQAPLKGCDTSDEEN